MSILIPEEPDFDQPGSRWQRPVEKVSWQDVIEFCARLSQKTGRQYRLPSEAEWEYACRGVAVTSEQLSAIGGELTQEIWNQRFCQPFYFGETIDTTVANYRGIDDGDIKGHYGRGVKGEYREQTTPVGSFNAPNAFGLHEMHGNIWEWCLDPWHGSYEGNPPGDGSVWDEENDVYSQTVADNIDSLLKSQQSRVTRGGSWLNYPWNCRSAFRHFSFPDDRSSSDGFRVLCARPSTP